MSYICFNNLSPSCYFLMPPPVETRVNGLTYDTLETSINCQWMLFTVRSLISEITAYIQTNFYKAVNELYEKKLYGKFIAFACTYLNEIHILMQKDLIRLRNNLKYCWVRRQCIICFKI